MNSKELLERHIGQQRRWWSRLSENAHWGWRHAIEVNFHSRTIFFHPPRSLPLASHSCAALSPVCTCTSVCLCPGTPATLLVLSFQPSRVPTPRQCVEWDLTEHSEWPYATHHLQPVSSPPSASPPSSPPSARPTKWKPGWVALASVESEIVT